MVSITINRSRRYTGRRRFAADDDGGTRNEKVSKEKGKKEPSEYIRFKEENKRGETSFPIRNKTNNKVNFTRSLVWHRITHAHVHRTRSIVSISKTKKINISFRQY